MKKILGISGTMKKDGFSSTDFLLDVALEEAKSCGAETKHIRLVDYNIIPCTGCGQCMNHQHCNLLLDPSDQLQQLYKECCEADAFIFASPVYALSLPAIWKNWLDRCEPCSDKDLEYAFYCYDIVKQVKGKAFRGKTAGEIIVSAGSGLEYAAASLSAAFTAVQLSVIATAGLALIEFDAQPGIQNQKWGRPINEAKFAIDIAKSIGRRVYQTIGYSTFVVDSQNRSRVLNESNFKAEQFENGEGKLVQVSELSDGKIVFIAATREHADQASLWYKKLNQNEDLLKNRLFNLTEVEKHPHFISDDEIKKNVLKTFDKFEYAQVLFDWDMNVFLSYFDYDSNYPTVIIYDNSTEEIIYSNAANWSKENESIILEILSKEN